VAGYVPGKNWPAEQKLSRVAW